MKNTGEAMKFIPSSDAPVHVLIARVSVTMIYPHGHPGISGLDEGTGCPRCNAEHALEELAKRAES